ncbi:hypothetical protein STEG23_018064 [Scotinomys teguina]
MARKAGQGEEEEVARARLQEEKKPARHEDKMYKLPSGFSKSSYNSFKVTVGFDITLSAIPDYTVSFDITLSAIPDFQCYESLTSMCFHAGSCWKQIDVDDDDDDDDDDEDRYVDK